MKTLIIYAHPNTKGHCSLILESVEKKLTEHGQEYELIDLYKMRYDPILGEDEHYTAGNRNISTETKIFQDKIKTSKQLIFIYPVWWGTMPAILKGFFDRTFTSHFAFRYEGKFPKGLLNGKKAVVIITSGAPSLVSDIFQMERPKKAIKNDILSFCGIKSKVLQIGNSTKLTEKQKNRIYSAVNKGINWLI